MFRSNWALAACAVVLFTVGTTHIRAETTLHQFERVVLSEEFFSEGACFGDINGDGNNDVVSGPYWYAGPDFRTRHAYAPAERFPIKQYSRHFFSFIGDFNADGRPDILAVPMPGNPALWFANPGKTGGLWASYQALDEVSGESPELADITGDGRPELVCIRQGAFGYATPNPKSPAEPWPFTPVTPKRGYGRFTHGLGIGDVNGDGRPDLLETHGWWEQTATPGELFRFHPQRFARAGGAQMYAYDFDGDGDNDVLSTLNAHAYGISWFEQRVAGGKRTFVEHPILTNSAGDSPYGLTISQMHAVALADIDGDGVQDFVTGKRFWAHGGGDPGAQELAVLYWFRTVRSSPEDKAHGGTVHFEPWLIDQNSGVGTQLVVGDVTGNGLPDVVVGNKLGTFLMRHTARQVSDVEFAAARPERRNTRAHAAGTVLFRSHVRDTGPLDPEAERRAFVVPEGFEVQLVAAEPDIAKPMNMAFDARGRLWVTTSVEYPYAAPLDRKGRDSIRILEDTTGDGRADVVKTFADGLNIPIGLYPYKDGVICYSIPHIWFLRDTDGDNRVDVRQKLYGPVGYERDTHGMLNGFTRGFDGWLYACHGFNNQTQLAGRDGHKITMHSGNTFRMRVDGSRVEHFTHGQVNPFGMTIDLDGELFTADCHSKPITMLLEGGYYESFGKPHDGLGFVPNVMEHMHASTGLCGVAHGRSTRFPGVYANSLYCGNVLTCRINRNSVIYNDSSIRAQEEPDFLISNDPWFRPVDLQVGPDGALYVADFYNRIIGHYEVPLDHPGRDRHRGRIWRIIYRPTAARADVPHSHKPHPPRVDLTRLTLKSLVEKLASPVLAQTRLAADRIVDHFGARAASMVTPLLQSASPSARAHALWVLRRLGVLSPPQFAPLVGDASRLVRIHAFRALGDWDPAPPDAGRWIKAGFNDGDPLVRRAAVMAAAKRGYGELVRPLFALYSRTPEHDVHLRHAIRMTLRNLLRDEGRFAAIAASVLSAEEASVLSELCMALKTKAAANFLLRNLERGARNDLANRAEEMRFVARYVSSETVATVTSFIRRQFGADRKIQLELLHSVQKGLEERGIPAHPAVKEWGTALVRSYLGRGPGGVDKEESAEPLSWTYVPHPDRPERANPWVLSTRRLSSDGRAKTRLISSFPRGEQRTGIYRSQPFELTDSFSFYTAGHDAPPDQPLAGKNFIRLRDAQSHALLCESPPRRNDVAQRVVWDTSPWQGRQAYVELVDGNTAGAWAWLAVGRFSERRLNPSRVPERRRTAAKIIGRLRLAALRPELVEILRDIGSDRDTASAVAKALVDLKPDARLTAVAMLPRVRGAGDAMWKRALEVVIDRRIGAATELLDNAMKVATAAEQLQLATELASDANGATMLLGMVEAGRASPRLLTRPATVPRLLATLTKEQVDRAKELIEELPDESQELQQLIKRRQAAYLARPGKATAGVELFEKTCAVCHQVGGKGAKVGPNLDGIGNRGLDRLVEDILAPNRNVDVAFRSTVVVTQTGQVFNGLVKRKDGAQLILTDSEAKEVAVPSASIVKQSLTTTSPMPANFAETLTEEQFRDLMAYLLALRQ